MTSSRLGFSHSVFLFFGYVIVAGVLLQRRNSDTFLMTVQRSLPSSFFLVFASGAIHGIIWLAEGMKNTTVFGSGVGSVGFAVSMPQDLLFLVFLMAIGFFLSIVFITVSSFAAGRIIHFLLALWAFGPKNMGKVNRLIKISTAVVATSSALVALVFSFLN